MSPVGTPVMFPSTPQPSPMITSDPAEDPSIISTPAPSTSGLSAGKSECLSTNTLKLGTASDNSSTPVYLDLSYNAKSNSSSMEDFKTELEDALISTAVFAIFGCNPETSGKIAPNTQEIVNGKRNSHPLNHHRATLVSVTVIWFDIIYPSYAFALSSLTTSRSY